MEIFAIFKSQCPKLWKENMQNRTVKSNPNRYLKFWNWHRSMQCQVLTNKFLSPFLAKIFDICMTKFLKLWTKICKIKQSSIPKISELNILSINVNYKRKNSHPHNWRRILSFPTQSYLRTNFHRHSWLRYLWFRTTSFKKYGKKICWVKLISVLRM